MSMFKNEKFWHVIAGAVGSAVAKKVLKAKKTRELAVQGLAHGTKFTADAKAEAGIK